jgi:hypothetical protein
MFASLRFLNSLVDTYSLRFEINFQTIDRVRFASIFKFFSINMFASLRNKFSNYRTCSLRFDIKKNIIFEAFTLSFAFDVSERVYTIEACAIPGGVYNTGA